MDEGAQGYYYDWTRADDFDYEWTAQLVDAAADPEGEADGDDEDPGADFNNGSGQVIGKEGSSCACSAGGPADLGWLALVLGLVPMVRRRR
jgi:MYXO-CTERM domain-containing protein